MSKEITGTFTIGEDNSVELPVNGSNIRYIPEPKKNADNTIDIHLAGADKPVRYAMESDLLAVKVGGQRDKEEWDKERAKFQEQLANANHLREETHAARLKAEADLERFQTEYKTFDDLKKRSGELETELGSLKESVTTHVTELTDRIRGTLISRGAKEEDLKDKTLEQLRTIEEALKLVPGGGVTRPGNYDEGPPGGGGPPETELERANRIIEEAKAKSGK